MVVSRRSELAGRADFLRRNMTPYERRLWFGFLSNYEVGFRCQKVIGDYIVDFYSKKVRLSIEIDGESHCSAQAKRYDALRTLRLEMREIKEIRFTNEDIKTNFEGVCEYIDRVVKERRNDIDSSNFSELRNRV